MSNFRKSLIAVLIGNVLYALILPLMPLHIRRDPWATVPGILIDFLLCLACYGLVVLGLHYQRDSSREF